MGIINSIKNYIFGSGSVEESTSSLVQAPSEGSSGSNLSVPKTVYRYTMRNLNNEVVATVSLPYSLNSEQIEALRVLYSPPESPVDYLIGPVQEGIEE